MTGLVSPIFQFFLNFPPLTSSSVYGWFSNGWADWDDIIAFPQIIVNGELVGGLDILREMIENGEWQELMDSIEEGKTE